MKNKILFSAVILFMSLSYGKITLAGEVAGEQIRESIENIDYSDEELDKMAEIAGESGVYEAEKVKRGIRYSLSGTAHVQKLGWLSTQSYKNSFILGTTGKGLRLEALRIEINGLSSASAFQYRTHCQKLGWLPWVVQRGDYAGTISRGLQVEAVQMKLSSNFAKKYSIRYKTHMQGIGWSKWSKDGATSGTTGQARRVEAVQVLLIAK